MNARCLSEQGSLDDSSGQLDFVAMCVVLSVSKNFRRMKSRVRACVVEFHVIAFRVARS